MLKKLLSQLLADRNLSEHIQNIPDNLYIPEYTTNGLSPVNTLSNGFANICDNNLIDVCYLNNDLCLVPFYIDIETHKTIVLVNLLKKEIVKKDITKDGHISPVDKIIKHDFSQQFYLPNLDFTSIFSDKLELDALNNNIKYIANKDTIMIFKSGQTLEYNIETSNIIVYNKQQKNTYTPNEIEYGLCLELIKYLLKKNNLPVIPCSTQDKISMLSEEMGQESKLLIEYNEVPNKFVDYSEDNQEYEIIAVNPEIKKRIIKNKSPKDIPEYEIIGAKTQKNNKNIDRNPQLIGHIRKLLRTIYTTWSNKYVKEKTELIYDKLISKKPDVNLLNLIKNEEYFIKFIKELIVDQ